MGREGKGWANRRKEGGQGRIGEETHTQRNTEKEGGGKEGTDQREGRWGRQRGSRNREGGRQRGSGSQVCFCKTPRPLLCLWTSITWDSFYVGLEGGPAVARAPVQGDHPVSTSWDLPSLLPGQAGLGSGAAAPEMG